MRRTKADANITRQRIMTAAFNTFLDEGFEGSSLEQICRGAGVTRGAAYWHFKNKRDLFAQTVSSILLQFDAVRQKISANDALDTRDKILELMWYPKCAEESFQFIKQASEYVKRHPGFEEIEAEIERDDMRLYWFFLTELTKIKQKEIPVENTAMLLHIIFNGLHSQHGESGAKNVPKDTLSSFIDIVLGI